MDKKTIFLKKESIMQFGALEQIVGGDGVTNDNVSVRETYACTQPQISCACIKTSGNCCDNV